MYFVLFLGKYLWKNYASGVKGMFQKLVFYVAETVVSDVVQSSVCMGKSCVQPKTQFYTGLWSRCHKELHQFS
jgi:hypothetical protein